MADFSNIIAEINANLPDNNQQRITPYALRKTMLDLTTTIANEQDSWEGDASDLLDEVEHALDNLIVDNLNSTSTNSALSANQGRVLDGRLSDVEDKTKYIDYADSQYTNMHGTLDISGDIEATHGQFTTLSTDAIDIEGEDLSDMLTEITDVTDQLSTGINDIRSYMRIMTDDTEVVNLTVGDTTITDYLEVGTELTLDTITIRDNDGFLEADKIYAYSQLVVGTHNVANELDVLNYKMVKCTQQQYDTWSALGQISSSKFYFIIEDSSSSSTASTTSETTSLDTTELTLTKSASLSSVSLDTTSLDTTVLSDDTEVEETDEQTETTDEQTETTDEQIVSTVEQIDEQR